jgi:hypothetical protein
MNGTRISRSIGILLVELPLTKKKEPGDLAPGFYVLRDIAFYVFL